jgi:uncharacterized protein (DUF58 family)
MLLEPRFLKSLESLALLARRLQAGTQHGERLNPRGGSSLEFRDHRSYSPGDDLRSVDWNAFARLGSLHVKQFSAERDLRVLVAVDVSKSMGFFGKREQALAVAAAAGYVALSRGDTLSWAAFADRRLAGGEGLRGKNSALEFLRGLDEAPGGGRTRLGSVEDAGGRPGLVLIVSDFCDPDALRALRALRPRGGALAAVHVAAPEEMRPPGSGAVRLVDSETGEELDLELGEEACEAHRREVAGRWEALEAACAREAVPYVRAAAGAPLRDIVAAMLRPGGALSRR